MSYKHLSIYERRAIENWLPIHKLSVIARKLERSRATVSRELERNGFRDEKGKWNYHAEQAHKDSKNRKGYLGCGTGFRSFQGKDPFANMNWSHIREKAGLQQHDRVRYNEWSRFYHKKKYRYEATVSLKSELWRSMYRKKEKIKKRIRLLTQFLEDKRRGRERIFLMCWGGWSQEGKDNRRDRYRRKQWNRKRLAKREHPGRRRQRRPYGEGLWSVEELLRWLEFLYGKKQEVPEVVKRSRPVPKLNFLLIFFKSQFIGIYEQQVVAWQGRGVSAGEEFEQDFKIVSVFQGQKSVLYEKNAQMI